jgi:hypothetical protein
MTDTTRESSRQWMGFKSNTRATVTAGLGDEERAPAQRQPYCTQHSPVPGGKRRAVGCGASSEVGVVARHALFGQGSLGPYQSESTLLEVDHFKTLTPPLTWYRCPSNPTVTVPPV